MALASATALFLAVRWALGRRWVVLLVPVLLVPVLLFLMTLLAFNNWQY